MFSSSIVCAIGGMASLGSPARIANCSRMWLSFALQPGPLLVREAEPGKVRNVLDVGTSEGSHGWR